MGRGFHCSIFYCGSLVHWFLFENSNSYKCPTQALLSADEDVILIQAYKMKAVFARIVALDKKSDSYPFYGTIRLK